MLYLDAQTRQLLAQERIAALVAPSAPHPLRTAAGRRLVDLGLRLAGEPAPARAQVLCRLASSPPL